MGRCEPTLAGAWKPLDHDGNGLGTSHFSARPILDPFASVWPAFERAGLRRTHSAGIKELNPSWFVPTVAKGSETTIWPSPETGLNGDRHVATRLQSHVPPASPALTACSSARRLRLNVELSAFGDLATHIAVKFEMAAMFIIQQAKHATCRASGTALRCSKHPTSAGSMSMDRQYRLWRVGSPTPKSCKKLFFVAVNFP